MDEEERQARLAAIQSVRAARAGDRTALQQLRGAQRAVGTPAQAVSNMGLLAVDRGMASAHIPDLIKAMYPRFAVPTIEQQDRLAEVSAASGGRSAMPVGAELSRDIEGARGTERVAGDQRLVVDAFDNPVATREEYPSIGKHVGALVAGQPNEASVIGTLGNLFGMLVRPTSTAFNYRWSNDPNKDLSNLPRDLKEAALNEKGNTVAEGGLVATRGSGFGDALRVQHRDILAGRVAGLDVGRATLGDVLARVGLPAGGVDKWLSVYPHIKRAALSGADEAKALLGRLHGVDPSLLERDERTTQQLEEQLRAKFDPKRPIADIDPNDPVWDSFGELISLPADPGNYVAPLKMGAMGASAVARKVPKVGEPVARALDSVFVDDITKAFSPERTLEKRLVDDMVKAGMDPVEAEASAKKIAAERYDDEGRIRAEGQMENVAQARLFEEAAKKIRAEQAPEVRDLLEGGQQNPDIVRRIADLDTEAQQLESQFGGSAASISETIRKNQLELASPMPPPQVPTFEPNPLIDAEPTLAAQLRAQEAAARGVTLPPFDFGDTVPVAGPAITAIANRRTQAVEAAVAMGAVGDEFLARIATLTDPRLVAEAIEDFHVQAFQSAVDDLAFTYGDDVVQAAIQQNDHLYAVQAGGEAIADLTETLRQLRALTHQAAPAVLSQREIARRHQLQAANATMQQRLVQGQAALARAAQARAQQDQLKKAMGGIEALEDKADMQQLLDIQMAAQKVGYQGLTSEERALIEAFDATHGGADEALLFQRQALADKLGVDVFKPHAFDKGTPQQLASLQAAKAVGRALRRNLEIDQRRGLLRKELRAKGFFPHAPRADLPVSLEKAGLPKGMVRALENALEPFLKRLGYNPRISREMVRMGDIEVLRRAAIIAVQEAQRQGRTPADFLVRFATNQDLAPLPGAAAGPRLGDRLDPMSQMAIRTELDRLGVSVDTPSDVVPTANRLAEHKGAHGRGKNVDTKVAFEADPIKGAAQYRNAMAPAQMQAAIGESVLKLRDSNNKVVVQSLEQAILTPRYGQPDHLLMHKMRTDPAGIQRALMGDDNDFIHDVGHFLKERGLVFVSAHDALVRNMPVLKNKVIPQALYQDLLKVAPRMNPGMLERFANVMAKLTNIWVPTVLNTPGFHIRNAFFGEFAVWLALGPKAFDMKMRRAAGEVAAAAEAGGLAKGTVRLGKNDMLMADLVREVQQLGIHEGGRVADLEGAVNRGLMPYKDEWVRNTLRRVNPLNASVGLVTKEPLAKVVAGRGLGAALGGGKAGGTAENVQRIMIYLSKRAEGATPREASRDVIKYMFDYTGARLSPAEKTLRRFMPFYQWVKQSMLLTIDQMLKQPQKYVAVDHLYKTLDAFTRDGNQDPRHVPDYLREAGAISTPFGEDDPGKRSLMQMERPGTQGSWLLAPALRGDVGGTASAVAQQLNPLATMGLERLTGKYVFGDREIQPGGYDPELSSQWTPTGMLERAAGMYEENIPAYLAKKWAGGYASLGVEGLLGLLSPELVSKNPRFSGVDETDRMQNRLISMLMGVRPTQTDAEAMASAAGKDVADKHGKLHARQKEAATRRLQEK